MLVLGIESSCDETGCAVVKSGKEILSNVVATQEDIHSKYGGVFPELASRRHLDAMLPVMDRALSLAGVAMEEIDLVAVANQPGLLGALLVGVNAAKALAYTIKKPLVAVNHVEAHIYSSIMSQESPLSFPCLGIVLSGAHTNIFLVEKIGAYQVLGRTVDDAIGESFDKVAKMMKIDYPGGAKIERLAEKGDPHRFRFKPGIVKGNPLDFSFSGLKTAVLYALKGQNGRLEDRDILEDKDRQDIAASFQYAVFSDLLKKIKKAVDIYAADTLIFGGGVTSNRYLRKIFAEQFAPSVNLLWPAQGLSLDNAAMIAGLGYVQFLEKGGDSLCDL